MQVDNLKIRIKICYISDFAIDLEGAASIHVYEVCSNLQKRDCDVTLVAPNSDIQKPNFQSLNVKCPRLYQTIFFQIKLIPIVHKLWRYNKPDYFYLRSGGLLFLPTILSYIYHIPLVSEVNGTVGEEIKEYGSFLLNMLNKIKVLYLFEKITYKRSYRIITVTAGIKKYLIEKFRVDSKKIFVIENGVNSNTFKPCLKVNNFTIGYVGGLYQWQGLTYVIQALPKILEKYTATKLLIIGEGPYKQQLKNLVTSLRLENKVEFKGSVDHNLIPNFVNSFEICVAYYMKNRSGIISPFKVYEYLSAGKPTIVSDIKGVGDKFMGVTKSVKPEDENALAKAIINLIDNNAEKSRLAVAGREYIINGHTWQDTTRRILNLLRK